LQLNLGYLPINYR